MRIFISVAEDSADVHAASLVRMAREKLPGAEFYGLTGPRLRALGVETVADQASHAAMLTGVIGVVRKAVRTVKLVEQSWRASPPDLFVVLDSPELHLGPVELGIEGLAPRAKRMGIPVLYYIAPQTWASREKRRNAAIARCIDRLACILPFEEAYFRAAGIRAEYVGHPLFEALQREIVDGERVRNVRASGRTVIALLPGSRKGVIAAMLPRQLEVVRQLRAGGRDVIALISCVSQERREQIEAACRRADVAAEIWVADNASLLTAADLALVASGTAALHVAAYRVPMLVMYDAGVLGSLHARWGHWVVRTPHFALPNILAGARIVPEFMPSLPHVDDVAAVAGQLLDDDFWRRTMREQIEAVVCPLERSRASERVCEMIGELVAGGRARPAGAESKSNA